jgi:hypothetical protein
MNLESRNYQPDIFKFYSDRKVCLLSESNITQTQIKIDAHIFKNRPTLLLTKNSKLNFSIYTTYNGNDDGYIRFLESSCASLFIRNLRIRVGGQVIDNLDNYGHYSCAIYDATISQNKRQFIDTITQLSLPRIYKYTELTAETVLDDTDYITTIQNQNSLYNEWYNNLFCGNTPNQNLKVFDVSIQLSNTCLDSESPIPLHLLNDDLFIEIDFEGFNNLYFTDASGNAISSITLHNIYYNATISYIPLNVSRLLFPNNLWTVMYESYKYENKFLSSGTQKFNDVFTSFKLKNAKAVLFWFHNPLSVNDITKLYSNRIKANCVNYKLKYFNSYYPKYNIQTQNEMFDQLNKIFNNPTGILNLDNYYIFPDNETTVTDKPFNNIDPEIAPPLINTFKRWIGGINLKKHNNDNELNGVDISENDIYLEFELMQKSITNYPTLYTESPLNENLILDVYCLYDTILTIGGKEIEIQK